MYGNRESLPVYQSPTNTYILVPWRLQGKTEPAPIYKKLVDILIKAGFEAMASEAWVAVSQHDIYGYFKPLRAPAAELDDIDARIKRKESSKTLDGNASPAPLLEVIPPDGL